MSPINRRFTILLLVASSIATAQLAPLQITSPSNGTIVSPGQDLNVTVALAQGVQLTQVGVFATTPHADAGPIASPPYQFSITIPATIPLGAYQLTAVGLDGTGNLVTSASVSIVVEPTVAVVGIKVQPSKLSFQFVGQQLPVIVTGTLADGSPMDLTQSPSTTYSSTNPLSIMVSNLGLVTAGGPSGPGTSITVKRGSLSASVPVSVPAAIRGDLNGDGVIDMNDLNIITIALNTPATKPTDARDLNGDGIINALDSRILVTLCTRPGCATH